MQKLHSQIASARKRAGQLNCPLVVISTDGTCSDDSIIVKTIREVTAIQFAKAVAILKPKTLYNA